MGQPDGDRAASNLKVLVLIAALAVIGVLLFALADHTFALVIGLRFGEPPWPYSPKSQNAGRSV